MQLISALGGRAALEAMSDAARGSMAEGRDVFDNEIVTAAGSVCPAKRTWSSRP